MKVDGKCPGHAKRLKLGSEATFMGWLQEGQQVIQDLAYALHALEEAGVFSRCHQDARPCLQGYAAV